MDKTCEDTYTDLMDDDPSWTEAHTEMVHRSKQNTLKTIQTIKSDMDNIFQKHFFTFYTKQGKLLEELKDFELLEQKVIHDWLAVFEKELFQQHQEEHEHVTEQGSKQQTNPSIQSSYQLFKTDTVFFTNTLSLFSCYFFSSLYHLYVILFGSPYYRDPSLPWCVSQDFVPDCLPGQPDDLLKLTA